MADNLSMSYSFQLNQEPRTTAPSPDDLIACTGCERVDLGNGRTMLLNRTNGRQLVVTPEVATALACCETFLTPQEHAKVLVDLIPQLRGQLADVTGVLKTMREGGLMTEARAVCDRLNAPSSQAGEQAPTRVCIITCDRPAAVQRLLDSILRHSQLGPHEELFLVDDSREPAHATRNRELVAEFNLTSPRNMHYVGAAAQRTILQQLIAKQPQDEAAIRFLLDRERWAAWHSYGLSRTLCLLLSVDRRCIILDDDILCRTTAPYQQRDGISFGGNMLELACFASEAELMQQATFLDSDPLSSHASCLGMPLAQAMAKLGAGELRASDLHGTEASLLNSLDIDSPILVTQCGSWGDPGTADSKWFSSLGQDSIKRMLAAPGGLASASANRHYWLGCSRPNFKKSASMSQATGLDNTHLLPPYFPVLRGEDYLFGSMTSYLHPRSAVLDYAWCVPHLPLASRSGPVEPPSAAKGGINLGAHYLTERMNKTVGGSPQTRLGQLSLLLRELAESSNADLLTTFRMQLAQQHAKQLQNLARQLKQAPALGSTEWQNYLRQGMENVTRALASPTTPADITQAQGELDEVAVLRQAGIVMGEFGTALEAWPAIRESAGVITQSMITNREFATNSGAGYPDE